MGVPLAALSIHPPVQPADPLEQYGKVMQLKNLAAQQQLIPGQLQAQQQGLQMGQQKIQENQLALQDEQAANAALHDPDFKSFDDLPGLLLKHGGSEKAVFGAKNQLREQKTADLALDQKTFDLKMQKNDALLGRLQSGNSVSDQELPQWLNQESQKAVQDGLLDPQHAQQIQQMAASGGDPKALRDQLQIFEKGLQGQKTQFEQTQKERTTAAAELTAQSRATSANTQAQEFKAKLPGGPLNAVTQHIQEQTDPRIIAAKAQEAEQNAIAAMKAHQAMYPAALANVAPQLVTPASNDATKADQAFTQAQQAGNEVKSMVDLAKGGNKVAYAYSPVTGVLQINVAGQIKRVNMPEIESYAGSGSALDRIKGFIGKEAAGASIPDNILNDMQTVSSMVTKGARDKYEQDIAGINSRYGAQFAPMGSAGGVQGGGPNKPQAKAASTAKDFGDAAGKPEGATGKLPDGTKIVVKNGRIVAQ